ncbi:hypothetical protein ACF0H5_012049 [Mactra antiquata]
MVEVFRMYVPHTLSIRSVKGQDNNCASSPCQNEALCENTTNGYQCYCKDGYAGENCERDFDECLSQPCKNNATCIDDVGNYTCLCAEGFSGIDCQIDIDDCITNPCTMSGTCIDMVGGYVCHCVPPYRGENCSVLPCDTTPCVNEIFCRNDISFNESSTGYVCVCLTGFTGARCDINIEDCDLVNFTSCYGNGACIDGVNSFRCLCEPGWVGDRCQSPIDDCIGNFCKNNATCIDRHLGYDCKCNQGYEGALCEREIDDCTRWMACQNGATCIDLFNDYKCECVAGWYGQNCTEEVNECENNFCQNGASCIDIIDGYLCQCPPFYTGQHCEIQYNPCSIEYNQCQNEARCVVPPDGQYRCYCPSGLTGPTCEVNIDECQSNPCKNNGTCEDIINGYICHCDLGWTGPSCRTNIDECASNPCLHGGICHDLLYGYECNCTRDYEGRLCEAIVDYCKQELCHNNGDCVSKIGGYDCVCLPPYTGTHCLDLIDACSSDPCANNATCMNTEQGYKCNCPSAYTGETCEDVIDFCVSLPCFNGGTCFSLIDDFYCACQEYLTGKQCTDFSDYCEDSPCKNDANCISGEFEYRCICAYGFRGNTCEDMVDFCTAEPCLNQANCTNIPGGFTCDCPPGFTGDLCQNIIPILPSSTITTSSTSTSSSFSIHLQTSSILSKESISSSYHTSLISVSFSSFSLSGVQTSNTLETLNSQFQSSSTREGSIVFSSMSTSPSTGTSLSYSISSSDIESLSTILSSSIYSSTSSKSTSVSLTSTLSPSSLTSSDTKISLNTLYVSSLMSTLSSTIYDKQSTTHFILTKSENLQSTDSSEIKPSASSVSFTSLSVYSLIPSSSYNSVASATSSILSDESITTLYTMFSPTISLSSVVITQPTFIETTSFSFISNVTSVSATYMSFTTTSNSLPVTSMPLQVTSLSTTILSFSVTVKSSQQSSSDSIHSTPRSSFSLATKFISSFKLRDSSTINTSPIRSTNSMVLSSKSVQPSTSRVNDSLMSSFSSMLSEHTSTSSSSKSHITASTISKLSPIQNANSTYLLSYSSNVPIMSSLSDSSLTGIISTISHSQVSPSSNTTMQKPHQTSMSTIDMSSVSSTTIEFSRTSRQTATLISPTRIETSFVISSGQRTIKTSVDTSFHTRSAATNMPSMSYISTQLQTSISYITELHSVVLPTSTRTTDTVSLLSTLKSATETSSFTSSFTLHSSDIINTTSTSQSNNVTSVVGTSTNSLEHVSSTPSFTSSSLKTNVYVNDTLVKISSTQASTISSLVEMSTSTAHPIAILPSNITFDISKTQTLTSFTSEFSFVSSTITTYTTASSDPRFSRRVSVSTTSMTPKTTASILSYTSLPRYSTSDFTSRLITSYSTVLSSGNSLPSSVTTYNVSSRVLNSTESSLIPIISSSATGISSRSVVTGTPSRTIVTSMASRTTETKTSLNSSSVHTIYTTSGSKSLETSISPTPRSLSFISSISEITTSVSSGNFKTTESALLSVDISSSSRTATRTLLPSTTISTQSTVTISSSSVTTKSPTMSPPTSSSSSSTTQSPVLTCGTFACLNGGMCREDYNGVYCDCVSNFIGMNCEIESNVCENYVCENGGVCTVVTTRFGTHVPTCNCQVPFTGTRCENEKLIYYPSFTGSSFLEFASPTVSFSQSNEIFVTIKTTQEDGVILFASNQNVATSDIVFINLFLTNGKLQYKYSCDGLSMDTIQTDMYVNTGDVYDVIIRQIWSESIGEWCTAVIIINNRVYVGRRLLSLLPPKNLDNIYIGGVPRYSHYYDDEIFVHILYGFVGCVQSFKVNEREIDLVSMATTSNNIDNCNVPVCVHNPCRNLATCHSSGEDWYCSCLPGYGGNLCERKLCDVNPCHHGGTCVILQHVQDNLCVCPYGRGGALCEDGFVDIFSSDVIDTSLPQHHVRLGRTKQYGWLQVDNQRNITGRSPGLLTDLNTNSKLYIGDIDLPLISSNDNFFVNGFIGCVFNLEIKSHNTNFLSPGTPPGHVTEGRNVGQCSTLSCDHEPCKNGGKCIDIGASYYCNCTWDWTGTFCSDKITVCDMPHACAAGSTCLPTNNDTYQCICPLGKKGEQCEVDFKISDPMFLGEHSYMVFDPVYIKRHLDMRLQVKLQQGDGLLFYAARRLHSTSGDFMSVTLYDGYIVFKFNLGTVTNTIHNNVRLKTDTWYLVQIGRNFTHGYVTVNDKSVVDKVNGTMSFMDVNTNFYLGSLPDLADISQDAFVNEPTSFSGCIREFIVNNNNYILSEKGAIQGSNIDDCDGTLCGYQQCFYGNCTVTRTITKTESFLCECPIDYTGIRCEIPIQCDNHNCIHGDCRAEDNNEYSCACYIGWSGPYCDIEAGLGNAVQFKDTSYITISDQSRDNINKSVTSISFDLRYQQFNGLIVWNGKRWSEDEDHLGIGLDDGRIKVVWNLGWYTRDTVKTSLKYNDGVWHTLIIRRDGQILTLSIDRDIIESKVSGDFYHLDTSSLYHFGSFTDNENGYISKQFPGSFNGCIRDLKINEIIIDFDEAYDGRNMITCDSND